MSVKTTSRKVTDGEVAVIFDDPYEVKDEHRGTKLATIYEAGRHVLSAESAAHFLTRGIARAE